MINAAAMNATLNTIKRLGMVEELSLIDELVSVCGWDMDVIETTLTQIVDWACHGLYDLGVPVAVADGTTPTGGESITYIWN